ncbi:matrilysin-like [Odontomachus brunneus]|uniref:matrilysin-like n=1 Tax=Odontomachus brunneus TaxID=486640 RepID=UPI0013F1D32D|nr:matrilysin-like [Odontomachus brunneus]
MHRRGRLRWRNFYDKHSLYIKKCIESQREHFEDDESCFRHGDTGNSSLIFDRNISHPNILLSFREGSHVFVRPNGAACLTPLDGPGGVLAHANYPTGGVDHVSEVHIDRAESWHIKINKNPSKKYSLLYILIQEIGHALGLSHSERKGSVMYAFAPERPIFPMRLNLDISSIWRILNIQQLYGDYTVNNYTVKHRRRRLRGRQ